MTSGNCSLIIKGHELNFKDIEKNLEIKPSRIIKEGQIISKLIEKSEFDIWVLENKYTEKNLANHALKELLSIILPHKIYLEKLIESADVRIKFYVQSNFAQINFELNPKVINDLARMGVIFEISILSWGEVMS